jgi:hypothetical protein
MNSNAPPNRAILAGSGIIGGIVGVKIKLVSTFKSEPRPNVSVISCERENGAARDVRVSETVFCCEPAPEKLWGTFVSDGPELQKVVVGGAKLLDVSTQLIKPTLPVPVVDVRATSLSKAIVPGGTVGNVKFWAANQRVTSSVLLEEFMISRVEPNSCDSAGPPGALV